jgi:hypothetical protein
VKTFLLAALGGAVAAGAVWYFARRSLDASLAAGGAELRTKLGAGSADLEGRLRTARADLQNQLKAQINAQVPPEVDRTIRATLLSYNITPTTGRRLDTALAAAERAGWL